MTDWVDPPLNAPSNPFVTFYTGKQINSIRPQNYFTYSSCPCCRTSAPPSLTALGPFRINVFNINNGFASGEFSYQYANLWSRRSTWGGNLPPGEGDSAFIPPGTTVVMDVSPPRLSLLVIRGNLIFDQDPLANIWLQVRCLNLLLCFRSSWHRPIHDFIKVLD